ncbi:metallophosphoesterase [candidate division KSB1 bacterium]|nr:metallophosphoesterase [candidate division KSB1 bacterium]
MKKNYIEQNLSDLFAATKEIKPDKNEKFVIFSDLHLGDGSNNDEFKKNSKLFKKILGKYYLEKGYTLVLNGDIEELQKFSLPKIKTKWKKIYNLLKKFALNHRLYKIIGNHDYNLLTKKTNSPFKIIHALKLNYNKNIIFIFHGFQADYFVEKFNKYFGFVIRYIFKPLGIKNYSTAYDSRKKFKVEKNVYHFSSINKIISIIGHTHRPLFESLSKVDSTKFKIEQLCREYPAASIPEKENIKEKLANLKEELLYFYTKNKKLGQRSSLYNSNLIIPCLFNSGCGIGKRGITAIEIYDEKIFLVYWFNSNKNKKYIEYNINQPEHLPYTDFYRLVLKEETLDYIFSRVQLLS